MFTFASDVYLKASEVFPGGNITEETPEGVSTNTIHYYLIRVKRVSRFSDFFKIFDFVIKS